MTTGITVRIRPTVTIRITADGAIRQCHFHSDTVAAITVAAITVVVITVVTMVATTVAAAGITELSWALNIQRPHPTSNIESLYV